MVDHSRRALLGNTMAAGAAAVAPWLAGPSVPESPLMLLWETMCRLVRAATVVLVGGLPLNGCRACGRVSRGRPT